MNRRTEMPALAGLVVALLLLAPSVLPAHAAVPPSDPAAPTPPADLTAQDVTAWLDGFLPARLEAAGISGGSVGVVAGGEVLATRGYGSTRAEGGEPVDPARTVFRAASVTKPITATAAMRLVQDGRLELDADVSRYLDFALPRTFDAPITLRHLLTHTAGFEERVSPFMAETPDALPSLREFVAQDPPEQVFAPGTTPAYSNYGLSLVGYLVERVAERPYEEYVRENVLDPLGMTGSSLAQPLPEPLASRMAAGYRDGGVTEVPFELIAAAPAGALSTTAGDMTRFMLAHLQEGDARVLAPEAIALMHAPGLGPDQLGDLAAGDRMTLGFFQEDRNGHRILGHGGDTNAFHSHLQIYPDDGAGIFVALNSTGTPASVTLTIRRQLLDGFADRYFPDRGPSSPTLDTSAEHARLAEGSYVSSRRMWSTFLRSFDAVGVSTVTAGRDGTLEEGTLQVSSLLAADGAPQRWREVEPWVWQEVDGQDRIAMRVEDGRVTAIAHDSAFALTRAGPEAALALPVLLASLAVLLVTVVAWPATALARHHYGHRPARSRGARRAHRTARTGAVVVLAAMIGWAVTIASILTITAQAPSFAVPRALQVLTVLGLVVLALGASGHAWLTWRTRAWWVSRVWSVALLGATAGVVWFGATHGLLAPSVTF